MHPQLTNTIFSDTGFQRELYKLQLNAHTDTGGRSVKNVTAHCHWIHNHLLHRKPSSILNLGCGIGNYSVTLARYDHDVTGVDISPYAINHAKKTNSADIKCQFIRGDILDLSLDRCFDIVILPYSIVNLFTFDQFESLITKIICLLNINGQFYFEGLNYKKSKKCIPSVWDNTRKISYINSSINLSNGKVKRYPLTIYYYSHYDYYYLLKKLGFKKVIFMQNPPGTLDNDNLPYESLLCTI